MLERIAWSRWLGDFTVIVIGVLCAFAIEDYGEFRSDRDRDSVYLQNLLADLNEEKCRPQLESILAMAQRDLLLQGKDWFVFRLATKLNLTLFVLA